MAERGREGVGREAACFAFGGVGGKGRAPKRGPFFGERAAFAFE